MKNLSFLHVLLFLLMLLAYTCASGQSMEEYIVTNTLDTLYGKIKPMDYGVEPKVQVETADTKKTVYSIFETKAYYYKGETYLPVRQTDRYAFMKLITSGYASLYAFRIENQSNYDGLYLTKMDGTFMEVPNLGFKKNMSRFFGDCGDIGERISSGDLPRNDLDKIISEYNACIDKRTAEKRTKIMATKESTIKANPWKSLEEKIKSTPDFEGKSTSLEMVTEIISKISKGEKVPSFVIDGLKNILNKQESLQAPLEKALTSVEE